LCSRGQYTCAHTAITDAKDGRVSSPSPLHNRY
jgi:hypothetical protein